MNGSLGLLLYHPGIISAFASYPGEKNKTTMATIVISLNSDTECNTRNSVAACCDHNGCDDPHFVYGSDVKTQILSVKLIVIIVRPCAA